MNKKKIGLLAFITMLAIGMLIGCSSTNKGNSADEKSEKTRVVKHELGETKVKENPKRVVVLELGFIDALLDAGIKPVGVADDDKAEQLIDKDVLKEIKGYKSVGTRAQPSLESIKLLKPDLIIADSERHKNVYKELSKIAPTIELKNLNANYDDLLNTELKVGEAVGKKAKVEKVVEDHKQKMKDLKAKAPKNPGNVLVIADANGNINARTSNFFTTGVLEQLGFKNALTDPTKEYSVKMTMEQLVKADPDKLIVMRNEKGHTPLAKQPLWKELKAVKNNQVYEVDVFKWSLRRSVQGANGIADEAEKLLFEGK
ncbi:ABC transporter substrate-binding protein [Priestia megaterium]|uniref:ABC transporter substrate-binding protein n=1 Tax=Priestia megaterium TaxID=1404 RepID=UPI0025A458B4|nr:ABC transporter substrate-binding protein [Priestia megaterium]MDM8147586.1 ABC transporter substrate-binding protein [Priestia megaterium]